jgi:hypothetical protein
MDSYFTPITPPRPLSDTERSLIDMLLQRDFPGVDPLRVQANHAAVAGEFNDGSGSIVLVIEPSVAVRYRGDWQVPVLARAFDVDGLPIQVSLHVIDGKLAELEITKFGSDSIKQVPGLDSFRILTAEDVWGARES